MPKVLVQRMAKSNKQVKPVESLFPRREFALTERERNVLKLFALGHSYQEIGDKLEISSKTVGSYLQRVREKVRARNRSDLIAYAIKEKMISNK
jgi:two-component system response regulator NreC